MNEPRTPATPATPPPPEPKPARTAALPKAEPRHRPPGREALAAELDVREGTVPRTDDGLNHFFPQP